MPATFTPDFGDNFIGHNGQRANPAQSQRSGGVLPPMTWLFVDHDEAFAACPILLGIGFAALCGFIIQHLGYFKDNIPFLRYAIFYAPTLRTGEIWRLATHVFLHSDFMHLVMNMLHLLNTLDVEAVAKGSGYPSLYSMGSNHAAGITAVTSAYGALIGSICYFGAMFEGASAMCFGLDGALLAACSMLLGAGSDPQLRTFLGVRGGYAALFMGIDLLRGCGNPQGTVGVLCHLAGFLAGICYVILAQPLLGGRPIPKVQCSPPATTSFLPSLLRPKPSECLAFFDRNWTLRESHAKLIAAVVFVVGVSYSLFNIFWTQRSVDAGDISVCARRRSSVEPTGGAAEQSFEIPQQVVITIEGRQTAAPCATSQANEQQTN